jgi:hypothetical protein
VGSHKPAGRLECALSCELEKAKHGGRFEVSNSGDFEEQQLAEARISATTANRYVTLAYGSAKLSLPIGVAVSPDGRYTYVTNNGNS